MDHRRIEISFFLGAFMLVLLVAFFVFLPYLSAIVLAATLAVVFYPAHSFLERKLRGSPGFMAFLTTVLILVVFLFPFIFFGFHIFIELAGIYNRLTGGGNLEGIPDRLITYLLRYFPEVDPAELSSDVRGIVNQALDFVIQGLGQIFSSVAVIFETVMVGLFALYYFLKDTKKIEKLLLHVIPLSHKYSNEVISRVVIAINSTIRGALVIAVVQGIMTGVGLLLFGVPNAVLWGLFAILASLIPILGTAVVIGPAVLYLLLVGKVIPAVGLLAWGTLIVGLVDNVLRPQLMKKSFNLHPLLILLSVLGGLRFFGPIGFIFGPIILSLTAALFDIYPRIVLERDKPPA